MCAEAATEPWAALLHVNVNENEWMNSHSNFQIEKSDNLTSDA